MLQAPCLIVCSCLLGYFTLALVPRLAGFLYSASSSSVPVGASRLKQFHRATPSPVERYIIRGEPFWVKRDDLLSLPGTNLSGNKARKLFALHSMPQERLPKSLASYGGAQSNAMVALAMVAHARGVPFKYFTKSLPKWLRGQPIGNYARALSLGANISELSVFEYRRLTQCRTADGCLDFEDSDGTLWVPQGVASCVAETGVRNLAQEILLWLQERQAEGLPVSIVVPAGTGTTALFLSRHLKGIATVIAIPCVGNGTFLLQQMEKLDQATGAVGTFPLILEDSAARKFAAPSVEALEIWKTVVSAGLPIDLVYAPRAWEILLGARSNHHPVVVGQELLYVHSGGLEGLATCFVSFAPRFLSLVR